MNKELQDLVWSILPKEFKEEVKYEYHRVATKASKEEYDLGFMHAHEGMFGLHNLTSDAEGEPNPAEPKCHVGQRVRCLNDGETYIVLAKVGKHHYSLQGVEHDVHEDYLEPYTEPTANKIGNPDISTETLNASKSVPLESDSADHVGKSNETVDRDHNRLHIAAMAMQGMLSNTTRFSSYEISDLVRISLNCADALLAEAEKV